MLQTEVETDSCTDFLCLGILYMHVLDIDLENSVRFLLHIP